MNIMFLVFTHNFSIFSTSNVPHLCIRYWGYTEVVNTKTSEQINLLIYYKWKRTDKIFFKTMYNSEWKKFKSHKEGQNHAIFYWKEYLRQGTMENALRGPNMLEEQGCPCLSKSEVVRDGLHLGKLEVLCSLVIWGQTDYKSNQRINL